MCIAIPANIDPMNNRSNYRYVSRVRRFLEKQLQLRDGGSHLETSCGATTAIGDVFARWNVEFRPGIVDLST